MDPEEEIKAKGPSRQPFASEHKTFRPDYVLCGNKVTIHQKSGRPFQVTAIGRFWVTAEGLAGRVSKLSFVFFVQGASMFFLVSSIIDLGYRRVSCYYGTRRGASGQWTIRRQER